MSFDIFDKLEAKVQQAVETITLLQMELEEQKEKNSALNRQLQDSASQHDTLMQENAQLKQEQHAWQERLQLLLGKMDDVS